MPCRRSWWPPIAEAVAAVAAGLNRYPDREFTALREGLAAYLSRGGTPVTAEQVWAGNGSNEVLLHLLQAFGGPGRTALGFTPAYSMHPIITTTTGTTWVDGMRGVAGGGAFDLDPASAVEQVRRHRPDVVFLCSPNNPTGTALDLDVVEAVHDAAYGALVVVDEAYAEFAPARHAERADPARGRPRLVVTRTMSKAFALAGGRLGYLAASPRSSTRCGWWRSARPSSAPRNRSRIRPSSRPFSGPTPATPSSRCRSTRTSGSFP